MEAFRHDLLRVVVELLKLRGGTREAATCLLAFVGDCTDDKMLAEVLGAVVAFVASQGPGSVPLKTFLASCEAVGGAPLLLPLFARNLEAVRLTALKLLGIFCGARWPGGPAEAPPPSAALFEAAADSLAIFPVTAALREAPPEATSGGRGSTLRFLRKVSRAIEKGKRGPRHAASSSASAAPSLFLPKPHAPPLTKRRFLL